MKILLKIEEINLRKGAETHENVQNIVLQIQLHSTAILKLGE